MAKQPLKTYAASPKAQAMAKFLKQKRLEAGYSMRELAPKLGLGVSHKFVGLYENLERKLDVIELESICTALECDTGDVYAAMRAGAN